MYTDASTNVSTEDSTTRSGGYSSRASAPSGQRGPQLVSSAPPSDWYTAVTGHPPTSPAATSPDDLASPRRSAHAPGGRAAARHDGEVTEPRPMAAPDSWPQSWERDDSSWRCRALVAERRQAELEEALGRRPAIEQAKGLLMGVFGLEADAAFDVLVWTSQHANTKLYLVAEQLVHAARTDANHTAPTTATGAGAGITIGERLTHALHQLAHPADGPR